jgi:hypothetical protein
MPNAPNLVRSSENTKWSGVGSGVVGGGQQQPVRIQQGRSPFRGIGDVLSEGRCRRMLSGCCRDVVGIDAIGGCCHRPPNVDGAPIGGGKRGKSIDANKLQTFAPHQPTQAR